MATPPPPSNSPSLHRALLPSARARARSLLSSIHLTAPLLHSSTSLALLHPPLDRTKRILGASIGKHVLLALGGRGGGKALAPVMRIESVFSIVVVVYFSSMRVKVVPSSSLFDEVSSALLDDDDLGLMGGSSLGTGVGCSVLKPLAVMLSRRGQGEQAIRLKRARATHAGRGSCTSSLLVVERLLRHSIALLR